MKLLEKFVKIDPTLAFNEDEDDLEPQFTEDELNIIEKVTSLLNDLGTALDDANHHVLRKVSEDIEYNRFWQPSSFRC